MTCENHLLLGMVLGRVLERVFLQVFAPVGPSQVSRGSISATIRLMPPRKAPGVGVFVRRVGDPAQAGVQATPSGKDRHLRLVEPRLRDDDRNRMFSIGCRGIAPLIIRAKFTKHITLAINNFATFIYYSYRVV